MAPVQSKDFAAAPRPVAPPCPRAVCPVSAPAWGSGTVPLTCLLCRLSRLDRDQRAQVLAAMERLADELSRRLGTVPGPANDPD